MISRRTFTAGMCTCLTGMVGGCVTHQTGPTTGLADLPVGFRPDPNTDEAGIWMMVERQERELRASQIRIRDQMVNDFVIDLMCRLTGDHCPDIRPYVVRMPIFNASCAPNGMVQVYSGLLLRCQSESQLAAVLGHEYAHYLKRHSLQRMRDARDRSTYMTMLSLGASAAGARPLDDLSAWLTVYGQMAFSRDHEREADEVGLMLMANAGYDPQAAAGMWQRLLDEGKAGDEKENFNIFTSTHPATTERIETLTQLAEKRGRPRATPPDRLAEAIAPIRGLLLADEINRGRFKRSEKLLDMLLADGNAPGEVLYYKGELYRRRAKDGDEAMALGYYHQACETAGTPPEAFRAVGLMRWRNGEKESAREYFRRYLHVRPDAGDRDMIKSYLSGA